MAGEELSNANARIDANEQSIRKLDKRVKWIIGGLLAYVGANEWLLIPRQVRTAIEGRAPEIQDAIDNILASYQAAQDDANAIHSLLVDLQATPVPKYIALPYFGTAKNLNASGHGTWIEAQWSASSSGRSRVGHALPQRQATGSEGRSSNRHGEGTACGPARWRR